jgi:hypothetical protein
VVFLATAPFPPVGVLVAVLRVPSSIMYSPTTVFSRLLSMKKSAPMGAAVVVLSAKSAIAERVTRSWDAKKSMFLFLDGLEREYAKGMEQNEVSVGKEGSLFNLLS